MELSPEREGAGEGHVVDLASVGGAPPLPFSRRDHRVGALRRSAARGRIGSMDAARGEAGLSDPAGALGQVSDNVGLIRWAVAALPHRNTLSDEERAELDALFLARAQAIGADPDLLAAFSGGRTEERAAQERKGTLTKGGNHDEQVSA